jgi:pimeloyl-ACP methyl ester carboxylesterase
MQFGNRLVFFSAKYAPFLLKALFAATANGVNKHPKQYMAKAQKQTQGSNSYMTESRGENTLMHAREAFRQGVEGSYRDMLLVSHPWQLDLDKIAVPVFMWHGTEDKLMPVSSARELSKLIPGCEAHFIQGAGHDLLGDEDIRSQIFSSMLSVNA